MRTSAREGEHGTQSIERAISILNCFLGERDALSLTELARKTEIPLPTASRITRLLAQEEYLSRDGDNKQFHIGRKLYMLGYRAKTQDTLRKIVHQSLVALRDRFGETATAYIRDNGSRRCFEKAEPNHDFRYTPTVGAEYSMSVGAGAKAFLAFMDEEERAGFIRSIAALTPHTVVDRETLIAELAQIRETRVAKSYGEYCLEFSSLASPVFNAKGEVICTIALTGPTSRFTPAVVAEASLNLLTRCAEISREFGWTPGDK